MRLAGAVVIVSEGGGELEPWPVAVDGEELLDALMAAYKDHLVFTPNSR